MIRFGLPYRWLAETGSTNDVARDWARAGAPAGALVVEMIFFMGTSSFLYTVLLWYTSSGKKSTRNQSRTPAVY